MSGPRPRRPSSPVSIWGSFDSVKCTRLLGRVTAMERAVITRRWNTSGSKSLPSLLDVLRHCTALLNKAWSYETAGSRQVDHKQRQGTKVHRRLLPPLKNCQPAIKTNLQTAQCSTALTDIKRIVFEVTSQREGSCSLPESWHPLASTTAAAHRSLGSLLHPQQAPYPRTML